MTEYTIASFAGSDPVGARHVKDEREARTLARVIYADLCMRHARRSNDIRVVVYPVVKGEPQANILVLDVDND